jgi:predicted phosphodiesterase
VGNSMGNLPVKYAILGDIHANLEALQAVLDDARGQNCTHFACVGDIVGYNANPKECLDIVRTLAFPCVKGNHDEFASTDEPLEHLNPRAAQVLRWTRRQLPEADRRWLAELKYIRFLAGFSLVHATLDVPQRWGYVFERLSAAASFNYQSTAVCFYGHTHLPMVFVRDTAIQDAAYSKLRILSGRKYFINVGSVGEPRDGSAHATYVSYDIADGIVELRRVPYDAAAAESKVRAAGLPVRRRGY